MGDCVLHDGMQTFGDLVLYKDQPKTALVPL